MKKHQIVVWNGLGDQMHTRGCYYGLKEGNMPGIQRKMAIAVLKETRRKFMKESQFFITLFVK